MLMETRRVTKANCATILPVMLAVTLASISNLAEANQLRAKVFMTQESIPGRLPEKELVSFAQKHQTAKIAESKENDVKDRTWSANLVIAFNAPPGELEYQLVFYDVQKGVRVLTENRSMLLSDRIQKTYLQRITFRRPKYQADRDFEVAVVIRGAEVGRLKFHLASDDVTVPSNVASANKPGEKAGKSDAKLAKDDTQSKSAEKSTKPDAKELKQAKLSKSDTKPASKPQP